MPRIPVTYVMNSFLCALYHRAFMRFVTFVFALARSFFILLSSCFFSVLVGCFHLPCLFFGICGQQNKQNPDNPLYTALHRTKILDIRAM